MPLKINPYHQLVWRTPHSLQIGVGTSSLILEQVTPEQERIIDALYYGVPSEKFGALASTIRMQQQQANALLEQLKPFLTSSEALPGGLAAAGDAAVMSLDGGPDLAAIIERRNRAVVQILKLDATGLTLLLALAASGVGTVLSPDLERVSESDCATNLFPRALLGYRRFQAAKLILESSWPGTRLQSSARLTKNLPRPSLVVMLSHQVTDPDEVGRWRAAEIPTLQIRFETEAVAISPVLDYSKGCLSCELHHLQSADQAFSALAMQLIESPLRFDDSVSRLTGSGIALRVILDYLDRKNTETCGYRLERIPTLTLHRKDWRAHPNCPCQVDLKPRMDAAG